jgi:DNA-directed RNA polymerase specialized sigma24 family protein
MSRTPLRPPRRGPAAIRTRIARAISGHARRERLTLMLLVVERLSPLEIAATLGISVRQVERTLDTLSIELARAARPVRPGRIRRAA